MLTDQLTEAVLALPKHERLDLARRLVESIVAERQVNETVAEGVRRIEDIVTGKERGLSEEEYRRAVG